MIGEIRMSDFIGSSQGQLKRHLDGCNFRFYMGYKVNKERSLEVGYPQHEDVEFIEVINFAGEKTPRAVEERDRLAYPQEYANFKARESRPENGYYLREWCMITPAALADLEAFGLRTIEQLASVSDEQLDKFKFLIEWNRKAKNWIKHAKSKQAECTQLEERVVQLSGALKKLEEQYMAALMRIEANEGTRLYA
jgi:hypothetical protein